MVTDTLEQAAHDKAIARLKKRRDFHGHLLVYVFFNAFLVAIWAVTTPDVFFWPVFPIVGWGIGLVMNAWDVYWRHDITEADIRREMERQDNCCAAGAGPGVRRSGLAARRASAASLGPFASTTGRWKTISRGTGPLLQLMTGAVLAEAAARVARRS